MFQIVRTATILFALLTVITGVVYPLAVTVIAQAAFPKAANGSPLEKPDQSQKASPTGNVRSGESNQHKWIGSELIGQAFTDPKYFWGRPSATAPVAYNGLGGSGSNQATTNPALTDAVRDRISNLRSHDKDNQASVPVDLVTASGSGLDPHISLAAAMYQAGRIARIRKIDPNKVHNLILSHTEQPTIGILGQTRVNVLKLNLALDGVSSDESNAGKKDL
jgi:K+-transporting ATPase ATPase C chain